MLMSYEETNGLVVMADVLKKPWLQIPLLPLQIFYLYMCLSFGSEHVNF